MKDFGGMEVQCVHKVLPGFQDSAALKQIDLDKSIFLRLIVKPQNFNLPYYTSMWATLVASIQNLAMF